MKAKVRTWLRNVENGNIQNWTEKVLNEIKKNEDGITTHQLRIDLKMAHQTLTSRLSELLDNGLIICESVKEIDKTSYSNYIYVEDFLHRKILVRNRKEQKYIQWLKKADDYFEFMNDETVKLLSFEQYQNNL